MPIDLTWRLVVDDLRRQRDQLEKELQSAREAYDREYRSISSAVGGRLGPFGINVTITREVTIAIFIAFNVVCFGVGIAFILQKGVLQVLGISLVVGGLFSFGTFMAQWWDHMWQEQNNTFDRVFKDIDMPWVLKDMPYVKLRQHAEDAQKLYEKLESLPEPAGQSPPSTTRRRRRR
jgi:hypothetical protein